MAASTNLPRRGFFAGLMAAIAAMLGGPIARVALFPVLRKPDEPSWTDLGPVALLVPAPGAAPTAAQLPYERRDGWQIDRQQRTVYILPGAGVPRVLSSVCPHLGCTVQWHPERDEFICPCHGGTYAASGARISGPPARGLDPLPARVEKGRLLVQFQSYRQLLDHPELAD